MTVITRFLLATFSGAGVILSSYLTALSFRPQTACVTDLFSCEAALTSEYSKIVGVIPLAALGVAWFSVAIGLSVASFIKPISPRPFMLWAIIGVLGIPPLLYIEVFLIDAICLLCTVAHALGGIILGLSIIYRHQVVLAERRIQSSRGY